MGRALLFVVVRMLAFMATAIGAGFDVTGHSLLGLDRDGLRWMAYIAFGVFFILTALRELLLYLDPHPRLEFRGFSPAKAEFVPRDIGTTGPRQGYFTRLIFKNNAKNPSGEGSTAQQLMASITVFDIDKKPVDRWDGRWANTDPPASYGDKWLKDKIDLPANNQETILDIGLRLGGDSYFQGWDNGFHIGLPEVGCQ